MENKFKRLAIISDCVHVHDEQGMVGTENHIFCRQMQALASYFEQVMICCPFVKKTYESKISVYPTDAIQFYPLPYAGGNTIKHKIEIIKTIPVWIKAFKKVHKQSDIVYLRFPNNLNIPGFLYFYFKCAKTFATYTGTWNNYKGEPLTYRFQKWMLKHFFVGPVWIYTIDKVLGKNFFKNYSPSYTLNEWNEETAQVCNRIKKYHSQGLTRPVFVTVGSLVHYKNQQYVLEVCKKLQTNNFSFHWYIVGDGPLKDEYMKFVEDNGLRCCVFITGRKTYGELRILYREAHFLVQPTLVEGFGKAPIEAMFHGVIPLLNKTVMAQEMTGDGERGFVFSADDPNVLEALVYSIMDERGKLAQMVENGRNYTKDQTLENWSKYYVETINNFF